MIVSHAYQSQSWIPVGLVLIDEWFNFHSVFWPFLGRNVSYPREKFLGFRDIRVSFAKWSNSQSLVSDRRQMGIELAVTDSIWTKASSTTDSTGEAHPVVNIDPVRIGFYDLPISPRISKLGRKYPSCGFGRKVLGAKPWVMWSRWSARFHPPKKWRHGGGLCLQQKVSENKGDKRRNHEKINEKYPQKLDIGPDSWQWTRHLNCGQVRLFEMNNETWGQWDLFMVLCVLFCYKLSIFSHSNCRKSSPHSWTLVIKWSRPSVVPGFKHVSSVEKIFLRYIQSILYV